MFASFASFNKYCGKNVTWFFSKPYSGGVFSGVLADDRGGVGCKKAALLKICHTYSAMMKLGSYTLPKEDRKNI